jgi:hypothetical protein
MKGSACLLIACLGNRNITVDGKYLETENFRDLTRKLADDVENAVSRIRLNILPDAILKTEEEFVVQEVLLFATDQRDEKRNFQDTLFEAVLADAKLRIDFPHIKEIKTEVLTGDPSDTLSMFQTFRFLIPQYLNQNKNLQVVFCQSGGTSQQKNALGLVLDFQLDPDKLKLLEVKYDPKTKISEAVWSSPDYLREITTLNQMEALIQLGSYGGAAGLIPAKGPLKMYRSVLEWCQAISEYKLTAQQVQSPNFSESVKKWFPFPAQWKEGSLFTEPDSDVSDCLVRKQIAGIQLKFSIAQQFYQKQDCINWLSWYYRFMEALLANFVERKAGIPLATGDAGRFEEVQNLLIEKACCQGSHYLSFFQSDSESRQKVSAGIPTQILVAEEYASGPFEELISSFRDTNSVLRNRRSDKENRSHEGIDILRNSLMHRGEGFDLKKVERVFPNHNAIMESAARMLNLPSGQNIFLRINQAILDKSRGR